MIELIPVQEAARRLGCSDNAIRQLCKAGALRFIAGAGRRKTMVFADDLDKYILEKAQWDAKLCRRASNPMRTAFTTSSGQMEKELSDKAFGRRIRKRRSLVSPAG